MMPKTLREIEEFISKHNLVFKLSFYKGAWRAELIDKGNNRFWEYDPDLETAVGNLFRQRVV